MPDLLSGPWMLNVMALGRKYAIVSILIVAAIVTPPDVITQIILFSVVYSLYEISILLVKLVEKKKEEALQQMDENI